VITEGEVHPASVARPRASRIAGKVRRLMGLLLG
jgi:hypothetical protein